MIRRKRLIKAYSELIRNDWGRIISYMYGMPKLAEGIKKFATSRLADRPRSRAEAIEMYNDAKSVNVGNYLTGGSIQSVVPTEVRQCFLRGTKLNNVSMINRDAAQIGNGAAILVGIVDSGFLINAEGTPSHFMNNMQELIESERANNLQGDLKSFMIFDEEAFGEPQSQFDRDKKYVSRKINGSDFDSKTSVFFTTKLDIGVVDEAVAICNRFTKACEGIAHVFVDTRKTLAKKDKLLAEKYVDDVTIYLNEKFLNSSIRDLVNSIGRNNESRSITIGLKYYQVTHDGNQALGDMADIFMDVRQISNDYLQQSDRNDTDNLI